MKKLKIGRITGYAFLALLLILSLWIGLYLFHPSEGTRTGSEGENKP